MNGTIYQFGATESETRHFIDNEEIRDLAARAHALGNLFDNFDRFDDQGGGVLRCEILRSIRELTARSVTVLS